MKAEILVLFAVIACAAAQFGVDVGASEAFGVENSAVGQTVQQTELGVGDRRQARRDARLAQQQARREALELRRARKDSRRAAVQERRAARLEARRQYQEEQYANGAEFQNVDAAVNKESSSKFALSIIDEQESRISSAISASSGSRFSEGAAVGLEEAISADQQFASDVNVAEDVISEDVLQAQSDQENRLAAEQTEQALNQGNLQASDVSQSAVREANNAVGNSQFGRGGIVGRK